VIQLDTRLEQVLRGNGFLSQNLLLDIMLQVLLEDKQKNCSDGHGQQIRREIEKTLSNELTNLAQVYNTASSNVVRNTANAAVQRLDNYVLQKVTTHSLRKLLALAVLLKDKRHSIGLSVKTKKGAVVQTNVGGGGG
ncbi:unnamed protein product, partial [Amoebophrya sp. A120]